MFKGTLHDVLLPLRLT